MKNKSRFLLGMGWSLFFSSFFLPTQAKMLDNNLAEHGPILGWRIAAMLIRGCLKGLIHQPLKVIKFPAVIFLILPLSNFLMILSLVVLFNPNSRLNRPLYWAMFTAGIINSLPLIQTFVSGEFPLPGLWAWCLSFVLVTWGINTLRNKSESAVAA